MYLNIIYRWKWSLTSIKIASCLSRTYTFLRNGCVKKIIYIKLMVLANTSTSATMKYYQKSNLKQVAFVIDPLFLSREKTHALMEQGHLSILYLRASYKGHLIILSFKEMILKSTSWKQNNFCMASESKKAVCISFIPLRLVKISSDIITLTSNSK